MSQVTVKLLREVNTVRGNIFVAIETGVDMTVTKDLLSGADRWTFHENTLSANLLVTMKIRCPQICWLPKNIL